MEIIAVSPQDLENLLRSVVREELGSQNKGDILSKEALGKEYGWSASTINRYMNKGMPFEGPGRPRFRRTKVDAWLQTQK